MVAAVVKEELAQTPTGSLVETVVQVHQVVILVHRLLTLVVEGVRAAVEMDQGAQVVVVMAVVQ